MTSFLIITGVAVYCCFIRGVISRTRSPERRRAYMHPPTIQTDPKNTAMKLPIRNRTSSPLRLFIEVDCDEYVIAPGGEAVITLDAGPAHSIDIRGDLVTVWNEGDTFAEVEIR